MSSWRDTVLPVTLKDLHREIDGEKGEKPYPHSNTSPVKPDSLEDSPGKWKSRKITKPVSQTSKKNQKPRQNPRILHQGRPSQKYLISWKIDQAGAGWLSLENGPGYHSKVIIKRTITDIRCNGVENLRLTQDDYLVNLREAFQNGESVYFIYAYHGFAIDLAVVCATPHVQFSEADIATVCRSTLRGLQYIHDTLRISHGDIALRNILLSEDGRIRIGELLFSYPPGNGFADTRKANIGRSMLENQTLGTKREDLKHVGLLVIHLKEPATILEDKARLIYHPQHVSEYAKSFVEEVHTALYKDLFKVLDAVHIFNSSSNLGILAA